MSPGQLEAKNISFYDEIKRNISTENTYHHLRRGSKFDRAYFGFGHCSIVWHSWVLGDQQNAKTFRKAIDDGILHEVAKQLSSRSVYSHLFAHANFHTSNYEFNFKIIEYKRVKEDCTLEAVSDLGAVPPEERLHADVQLVIRAII